MHIKTFAEIAENGDTHRHVGPSNQRVGDPRVKGRDANELNSTNELIRKKKGILHEEALTMQIPAKQYVSPGMRRTHKIAVVLETNKQ